MLLHQPSKWERKERIGERIFGERVKRFAARPRAPPRNENIRFLFDRPNLKITDPSCGNRGLIIENDITAPIDILQIAFAFAQLLHGEALAVHLRWRHLSNARPRIKSDPHYNWNHFTDVGGLFRD